MMNKHRWIRVEAGKRKYDKIILDLDLYMEDSKYFTGMNKPHETYMRLREMLKKMEDSTIYTYIYYILKDLDISPKDYCGSLIIGNMYGAMKVDKQYSDKVFKIIKKTYAKHLKQFELRESSIAITREMR